MSTVSNGTAPGQPPSVDRSTAVIAFVAGAAIGAFVAVAVLVAGDLGSPAGWGAAPAPTVTVTATPSPTASSGTTITVPDACLDSAELASEATDLGQRALDALRRLDPADLQEVVADIRDLDPQARAAVEECRRAAGQG